MAVFKRGGNWWIGYRGTDGKYHRERVGPSKAQATDRWHQRKTEVNEGRWFPVRSNQEKTFNEVINRYWTLYAPSFRSKSWGSMIGEIREVLGPKRIGSITSADIQSLYNAIEQRASTSTANRKLTLIKMIFNKAKLERDFHGDNPCLWVKAGREPNHRLRWLSADEMARLLRVAHPRLYPFVATALLTGMRKAEILFLDWQNVDLELGVIHVLKSKSGKPREVAIPGKLREVFLSLGPKSSGPVFDLPPRMLRRYFEKALKAAGIPAIGPDKVTIHTCRHTFASWFMQKGGSIYTLQNLLGHSSLALTQRYAHLGRGHLQSELAIFESAIPVNGGNRPKDCTRIAPPVTAELGHVGKVL